MQSGHPAIHARSIAKAFGKVQALRGVDLTIAPGEFVALLGPNGAGKTTLVEIIEGIRKPDTGDVSILGFNWESNTREIRRLLGLSLQETNFIDRLNAREILRLFASFYGIGDARVDEVLGMIGLRDKARAWTMHLSGGQRQRLALGVAILHEPEIFLLDEPTTGLDPGARHEVWELLSQLKGRGRTTLLLTTHYMEEAAALCERVVLLDQGRVLRDGPVKGLLVESGKANLEELFLSLTGRRLGDDTTA